MVATGDCCGEIGVDTKVLVRKAWATVLPHDAPSASDPDHGDTDHEEPAMNANAAAPQPIPSVRPRRLSAGPAGQHALFTWLVLVGANATLAKWLREHNGGRFDCAVRADTGNALMCAAIALAIACHRWLAPLV